MAQAKKPKKGVLNKLSDAERSLDKWDEKLYKEERVAKEKEEAAREREIQNERKGEEQIDARERRDAETLEAKKRADIIKKQREWKKNIDFWERAAYLVIAIFIFGFWTFIAFLGLTWFHIGTGTLDLQIAAWSGLAISLCYLLTRRDAKTVFAFILLIIFFYIGLFIGASINQPLLAYPVAIIIVVIYLRYVSSDGKKKQRG